MIENHTFEITAICHEVDLNRVDQSVEQGVDKPPQCTSEKQLRLSLNFGLFSSWLFF